MGLFDFLKRKKPAGSAAPKVTPTPVAPKAAFRPYTGGGVCDVCNRPLSGISAWVVPNDVFYASKQYRQWHQRQMSMMGMSAADANAALEQMRRMDTSPGSAVCENCIHMFR